MEGIGALEVLIMKLFIKTVLYIISLLVVFIILIASFGSFESKYKCIGVLDNKNQDIFLKLEEYSILVDLYKKGERDGTLMIEIPGKTKQYFGTIIEIGDMYQIYDNVNSSTESFIGQISILSNHISLKIPYYGFFEGDCSRI